MGLIPRSLIDQWQDTIDGLTTNIDNEGLSKTCTLIFETGFQSDSSILVDPIGKKPKTILPYGGRGNASSLTGNELVNNSGDTSSDGLKATLTTKDIQCRIYPVTKPYEMIALGVVANETIWKVNTKKEYMPDMVRCKELILYSNLPEKRIRVILIRPPVQYGLGEAYNCISYWKEI